MENLRKINDINYTPIKGDSVFLNDRFGSLIDDEFLQIIWSDNNEIEDWSGGWQNFLDSGGFILII